MPGDVHAPAWCRAEPFSGPGLQTGLDSTEMFLGEGRTVAGKEPFATTAAAAASRKPDSLNAVEIAMAELNDGAPQDGPAGLLLRRQTRLIDAQIASERMGIALKLLTAVLGLGLAIALGSLVWSASQERGLVIEPFSVPPDFAQRGITGQVLASQLLDRLSAVGEQTESVRAPSTYANNWNGDIKVQIPQTGVSVGELRRVLVEWLGRQTSIAGELYRTPDGLVLAARTGTAAASVHVGKSGADLPSMMQAAAEAVYADTQPYRYAIYVAMQGGPDGEARSRELLEVLARTGDTADRMWAHSGLSASYRYEGRFAQAILSANDALAIEPAFPAAYSNRAAALSLMGRSELALQDVLRTLEALEQGGERFLAGERRDQIKFLAVSQAAYLREDHAGVIESNAKFPGQGLEMFSLEARLRLHDTTDNAALLEQIMQTLPPSAPYDAVFASEMATVAALHAWERGDWAGAYRLVSGFDETLMPASMRGARRVIADPLAARAAALAGDLAAARTLVAGMPSGCYECTWTRGMVAAAAGENEASDRAFAEAVRRGPSLPTAHAQWGYARLARGDTTGAIEQFRLAHRKGPEWADPLKSWGDALMQEGDVDGALERYAAAAERAPRWGSLHIAWGEALQQAGDAVAARGKFLLASELGLSPADGQRVRGLLAAAPSTAAATAIAL